MNLFTTTQKLPRLRVQHELTKTGSHGAPETLEDPKPFLGLAAKTMPCCRLEMGVCGAAEPPTARDLILAVLENMRRNLGAAQVLDYRAQQ